MRCCSAPSTSRTRSRPRCSTSGARCCTRCRRPVLWLLQWNTNVQATLTKAADRARHRRRASGVRAAAAARGPPQPPRPCRRLSRRLAVQCPHHRRRGALGRRAGGDDRGPDLRPARRLEPAAHLGTARAGVRRRRRLPRDRRRARRRPGTPRRACARACRPSDPPTVCSTAPPSPPTSSSSTGACGSVPSPASGPSTCPRPTCKPCPGARHEGSDPRRRPRHPAGRGNPVRPKPMVEIGGKPVLWHILKTYSHHGINEFVICLRLRGYVIKEYFANYFLHMSDVTFDLAENRMEVCHRHCEPWRVTLVDTGEQHADRRAPAAACATISTTAPSASPTATACRTSTSAPRSSSTASRSAGDADRGAAGRPLRRARHRGQARSPASRKSRRATAAGSTAASSCSSPRSSSYIEDDATVWEREPLEQLARDGQLSAFTHRGFWQPMDTLRDKMRLEELWQSGAAPWKVWA